MSAVPTTLLTDRETPDHHLHLLARKIERATLADLGDQEFLWDLALVATDASVAHSQSADLEAQLSRLDDLIAEGRLPPGVALDDVTARQENRAFLERLRDEQCQKLAAAKHTAAVLEEQVQWLGRLLAERERQLQAPATA